MSAHQIIDRRESKVTAIAATLPTDRGALLDVAAEAIRAYDAAIVGCAEVAAYEARDRYEAAIWTLNGGSFFGCKAHDDAAAYVIERHCAARSGTAPLWGQRGEFLVTTDGMRALVSFGDGFGSMYAHFEFFAVDVDLPFISETGYLSHFSPVLFGCTVHEAAEGIMRELLAEKGRVLVAPELRQRRREWIEARDWLDIAATAQLTYEESSGQVAFSF